MEEQDSPVIEIAGREVGKSAPVFVIAEIGINHNGSVDLAKEMISAAKWAGADAVKFQKRTPDITTPEHVKNQVRETPWGSMTYLEYKKTIEFGHSEYDEINQYCASEGVLWSASAWDELSAEFLDQFDIAFHKLPSAHLTNNRLRERLNRSFLPLIASTGMSTWNQITDCVSGLDRSKTVLMHSVSAYPLSPEDSLINTVPRLLSTFDFVTGYSGHEAGNTISLAAVALGARVVERHFTIDQSMWGTDQSSSIVPGDFRKMVEGFRELELALSREGRDTVLAVEEKAQRSLRTGPQLISGHSQKEPA